MDFALFGKVCDETGKQVTQKIIDIDVMSDLCGTLLAKTFSARQD